LRSDRLYNSSDEQFSWNENGQLFWQSVAVGRLEVGVDILTPKVIPIADSEAGAEIIQTIKRRLDYFVNRTIERQFEPLLKMQADDSLSGIAKGVAFRLIEGLGLVSRDAIADEVKAMDQKERSLLRKHGLRFGQFTIFHYLMLKPAPTRLRLLLWSLFHKSGYSVAPPPGLVTIPKAENATAQYYTMAGYKLLGEKALRVDMLERLADLLRTKDVWNGFEANVDMLSMTGLTLDQFSEVLRNLGYTSKKGTRLKIRQETDQSHITETTDVSKVSESIIEKSSADESKLSEEETFYIFKIKKTIKSRKKLLNQDLREKRKPSVSSTKTKNENSGNRYLKYIKTKQEIDPSNPFSALIKLKNKL